MAADDETQPSPVVRITLRDIWAKQEEMSQTLQTVAQAVAPLTTQVAQIDKDKLGVSDYKYERDMRDHQTADFRTQTETRVRELELWKASRSGVSSVLVTSAYVFGGAGAAFLLNHLVK